MKENPFKRLGCLRAELARMDEQCATLEADITSLTRITDTVQGSSTHFPFTLHSIGIEGVTHLDRSDVRELRCKLAVLRAQLKAKRQEYLREYDALSAAIAGIEDVELRTMIHYRYVSGMSYAAIATRMAELYHKRRAFTADGVRVTIGRYLKVSKIER